MQKCAIHTQINRLYLQKVTLHSTKRPQGTDLSMNDRSEAFGNPIQTTVHLFESPIQRGKKASDLIYELNYPGIIIELLTSRNE